MNYQVMQGQNSKQKKLASRLGYAVAMVALVGAVLFVSVAAQSGTGLMGFNARTALAEGRENNAPNYGYHGHAPQAFMWSTGQWNYSKADNRFNYLISYSVTNVQGGSIKFGNIVIANNINSNGSAWTGMVLKPNTKYTFEFHQDGNGKGQILNMLEIKTPFAPCYGYGCR